MHNSDPTPQGVENRNEVDSKRMELIEVKSLIWVQKVETLYNL
jgi:hypothetical protein